MPAIHEALGSIPDTVVGDNIYYLKSSQFWVLEHIKTCALWVLEEELS